MLDRNRLLAAFRRALETLGENPQTARRGGRSPRTIALRAHEIYCSGLAPDEKRPAADTFRKFATGLIPCPEVVALLKNHEIRPVPPQRLDRLKLHSVFSEAIQRLEARILKGQARPLQIVRRAYEIYTRDAAPSLVGQPSHRTFESLIYGKSADPEILTLIESALTQTARTKKEDELP